jgi:Fe-S cluster assembly iron-binding protein IscA
VTLDEPQGNETKVKVDDLEILVSNKIMVFAEGSTIDYYDYKGNGWFTVERAGATC